MKENIIYIAGVTFSIAYAYYWLKACQNYKGKQSHKLFEAMVFFPENFTSEGKRYHRALVFFNIALIGIMISLVLLWEN